jgi:hypothetical protein
MPRAALRNRENQLPCLVKEGVGVVGRKSATHHPRLLLSEEGNQPRGREGGNRQPSSRCF